MLPEELYSVKREEGLVTQAGEEHDLVALDESTEAGAQTKRIVKKYQELKEVTGKFIYLYLITKRVNM